MDLILEGNLVNLRLANENDAQFILSLRNDDELNQFLSPTGSNANDQVEWIRKYKLREKSKSEFYFIVENKNHAAVGTIRLYDIDYENHQCTWGSFILSNERPNHSSYEVIKLSTDFAFNCLKLRKILLDVRNGNCKAIHIYEKYGFIKYKSDEIDSYYYLKQKDV